MIGVDLSTGARASIIGGAGYRHWVRLSYLKYLNPSPNTVPASGCGLQSQSLPPSPGLSHSLSPGLGLCVSWAESGVACLEASPAESGVSLRSSLSATDTTAPRPLETFAYVLSIAMVYTSTPVLFWYGGLIFTLSTVTE